MSAIDAPLYSSPGMIDSKMITFLSLLALVCIVFLVAVVTTTLSPGAGRSPGVIASRPRRARRGRSVDGVRGRRDTTFGSLWLSEVEKLPPCHLCWLQRYFMYPQTVLLGLAAVLRSVGSRAWLVLRWISLPMVILGAGISTYHYLSSGSPMTSRRRASTDVPCSTVWIWKYHFLSIPGMAWLGFVDDRGVAAAGPSACGGAPGID